MSTHYRFNRINSGRSIPTAIIIIIGTGYIIFVSIVSIQADQSRLICWSTWNMVLFCFNRINSGRSIPTISIKLLWLIEYLFQSYQFRQINPDYCRHSRRLEWRGSFNRINSGRSIPTGEWLATIWYTKTVSIVSIQADQSRPHPKQFGKQWKKSFNRINSGRSIPTWIMWIYTMTGRKKVSIVSIQADQSRQGKGFWG